MNAVCPGIVDTDFNWRLDDLIGVRQQGLAAGEFMKQRAASVPLGRLAEPDDVARVIVFLASRGRRLHHGAGGHRRRRLPDALRPAGFAGPWRSKLPGRLVVQ